ncbi:hypothetical protein O988_02119 [Pseudogymnoascus sp. VKM F-3808]|nr:hypothetical protein V490_01495 [Pseudogymnoascus sp. VKM F-3557]KFY02492.1 hypothetical protein O988_02119 [Pseudogymnoascus sp. VKM F-3808]KFY40534.1 hypothetical protein V495_05407 [Pseudogymnoascus sp. VKM F-4514 (FW-929)]KFY56781.1 hypothetical protein V497_05993 [Pseudogymnoascus sp. VKM F-4516 (FW-969)]
MDRDDNAPPVQPLSKRDKRRTALIDRLNDITMQFSANKDQYYREQLGVVQQDIALILHAVPYVEDPTKESTVELLQVIHKLTRGDPRALQALKEGDIQGIGGKIYHEFQDEIQDAMERRDASLSAYAFEHKSNLSELNTSSTFLTKLAGREHSALASTIRDRLINSITERKRKLNRDMTSNEGIDNSNAYHYHPAQYSVLNPASPGGVLGKRSSRHRRDLDDLPAMLDPKRKRRAVDDGRASPVPTRRAPIDLHQIGSSTPLNRFTEKAQDPETPLYSVDKLFTEKELSLLERQAAEAAHKYMVRHKFNEAATRSQSDSDGSRNGDADQRNGDSTPDSPLIAPAMDRTTRSTRGIGGATSGFIGSTGIEVIADLTLPSTFTGQLNQMPRLPPPLYPSMTKFFGSTKGDNMRPNLTEGVAGDELNQDMNRIEWGKRVNSQLKPGASLDQDVETDKGTIPGDRRFLAAAIAEPGVYPVWLSGKKREERIESEFGVGKRAAARLGLDAEDVGSTAMSKQSSRGGSEAGGVEMSREGSRRKAKNN